MRLIKGQNVALDAVENLVVDIGWRSLAADLNLQAYGIIVDKDNKTRNAQDFIWQSTANPKGSVVRGPEGRRFEIDLTSLSTSIHLSLIHI